MLSLQVKKLSRRSATRAFPQLHIRSYNHVERLSATTRYISRRNKVIRSLEKTLCGMRLGPASKLS